MRTPTSLAAKNGSRRDHTLLCKQLVLGWLLLPHAAFAAPDALNIMTQADSRNRATYEVATLRMESRGKDNEPVTRQLTWRFINDPQGRVSLMKFTAPAIFRGVGLLVVEESERANAIWHYEPATRNVRRISGAHRQNRFAGSEFAFEDFEGMKLSKYAFTWLREEQCRGRSVCNVVQAQATDPDEATSSSYAKKVFWVEDGSFIIVKTELYDTTGKLAKIFESLDFRQVGGYWRPKRQTMRNVGNDRMTVMIEVERMLDQPFDRYYVSQQYLRSE